MRTMRFALILTFSAVVLAGCDRTPAAVRALAEQRLPAMREYVKRIQQQCTGKGPEYAVTDWGSFASDSQVLNVKVTCKTLPGLGIAAGLKPMRPVPSGDKMATSFRIGVSKDKKHQGQEPLQSFLKAHHHASSFSLLEPFGTDSPTPIGLYHPLDKMPSWGSQPGRETPTYSFRLCHVDWMCGKKYIHCSATYPNAETNARTHGERKRTIQLSSSIEGSRVEGLLRMAAGLGRQRTR